MYETHRLVPAGCIGSLSPTFWPFPSSSCFVFGFYLFFVLASRVGPVSPLSCLWTWRCRLLSKTKTGPANEEKVAFLEFFSIRSPRCGTRSGIGGQKKTRRESRLMSFSSGTASYQKEGFQWGPRFCFSRTVARTSSRVIEDSNSGIESYFACCTRLQTRGRYDNRAVTGFSKRNAWPNFQPVMSTWGGLWM